jgi:hypothetical protein
MRNIGATLSSKTGETTRQQAAWLSLSIIEQHRKFTFSKLLFVLDSSAVFAESSNKLIEECEKTSITEINKYFSDKNSIVSVKIFKTQIGLWGNEQKSIPGWRSVWS